MLPGTRVSAWRKRVRSCTCPVNMPDWIQPWTYLIPLRYFLVILRGIFLKGVGLERGVRLAAAKEALV